MNTSGNARLVENDSLGFNDDFNRTYTDQLKHPVVALLHVLFRSLAAFFYILLGLFSQNFISSFVLITIVLSIDFWLVKNITGRLMVGMRWWNFITDDGKSVWIFESKKDEEKSTIHPKESNIFWLSLIASEVFWLFMFIISFFSLKFRWLVLICIALTLNSANLYGYTKCSIGEKQKIGAAIKNFFQQNFLAFLVKNNANSNQTAEY